MNNIEIYSLPQIHFAHAHSRNDYCNHFPVREKQIEISYVTDGELHIKHGDSIHIAKQNDVICMLHDKVMDISSKGFHSHHTVSAYADWKFTDVPINGLFLPIVTPQDLDTTHICKLIDDFIYGQNSYEESISKNACKFLRILTEIDYCNRKAKRGDLSGELLYAERAKKFIHQHLNEPLTQAQVARYLGISPGYLCGVFKKVQGITLMQYINKAKLEAISQIMAREHLKLYEAAALFGYTDANYVSRLYKKMFQHNISDKPKKS